MKTIILRGIDNELADLLKKLSEQKGQSRSRIIIDTLKRYYGFKKEKKFTRRFHDLDHLFGSWTKAEFDRIQGSIDTDRNAIESLEKG